MPVLRTSPSQMFRPWNATDSLHHCCCMGCCRRCRISGGQAVWIHGQLACTHVQPKIALRERVYRDTLWTTHDPPMCPGSSQHLSFGGSSPSRADGEMLLRSRRGSVQRCGERSSVGRGPQSKVLSQSQSSECADPKRDPFTRQFSQKLSWPRPGMHVWAARAKSAPKAHR